MTIADYRKSLGLTQDAFAALLNLRSKGHVSDIEKANRASPDVALALEAHSRGAVDAGAISPMIAAARQGIAA